MTTTLMKTHSPADRVLPCAAVRLSRCTAAAHFSNMKKSLHCPLYCSARFHCVSMSYMIIFA